MKLVSLLAIVAVCCCLLPACNMTDYESKKQIVQDSLINVFPTWQAAKIWIDDDNTKINVVIGDLKYYEASQDLKNQKAEELGKMILRIFGKGNFLKKGALTVTKDVRNTSMTPPDGISMDMNIEKAKGAGH